MTPELRILYIGCIRMSRNLLEVLLDHPHCRVAGVACRATPGGHDDFEPLAPLAEARGIPVLFLDREKERLGAWARELAPDVGYCFGLSMLLPPEVLEAPRLGFAGYHPAPLPQGRGRHPVIWSLALGFTETASTFFAMTQGADEGDILSQVPVSIGPDDYASDLYARLEAAAREQVADMTTALAQGTLKRRPQDESRASSWRKRGERDGRIDWRMGAATIRNLVRALAEPYPGAHFVLRGRNVKVWRAEVVEHAPAFAEPGKVLAAGKDFFTVKCGEKALKVTRWEGCEPPGPGTYLEE